MRKTFDAAVLMTIDLDDEAAPQAAKVSHIWAQRDLTTEMRVRGNKTFPHCAPKAALGIRLIATQR